MLSKEAGFLLFATGPIYERGEIKSTYIYIYIHMGAYTNTQNSLSLADTGQLQADMYKFLTHFGKVNVLK